MIKNTINSKILLGLVFMAVFFAVLGFSNTALASSCAGRAMTYQEFRSFKYYANPQIHVIPINISGFIAGYTIINDTDCYLPASIAAYKMYDRVLENQILFSGSPTTNVAPHSSAYISTSLPNCMAQIDGYFGPYVAGTLTEDNGNQIFVATFYQDDSPDSVGYLGASGNFCTNNVNPPPVVQTLTASCSATPASANIGDYISWNATAMGGTGSYSYSWTGTDGLYGNSSFVSKPYFSAGTKIGVVTVTSGSQSITKNCSATIAAAPVQTLTGTCSVSPSSVNTGGYLNWTATANGGTGSYTYSWSGTDGLYGNSYFVSKPYSTAGTKNGMVTITSGSQTINPTCSGVVNDVVNNNLSVSCNASPSNVNVNDDVTWYANANGGNGSYSYSWNGTDGLSGGSRSVSWNYGNYGTKTGTVTVTSNGQTAIASCTVGVNQTNYYNNNLFVSCYASPANPAAGNQMNWYATASGGNGNYNYNWSGTDGLNSSSRSPSMVYYNPGSKLANVTVYDSNGQRASNTCSANVNSVLAFSQSYQPPMASAVYLSQVPYTGLADNMKLYFFVGMLALVSAWLAYIVIAYKKEHEEINS